MKSKNKICKIMNACFILKEGTNRIAMQFPKCKEFENVYFVLVLTRQKMQVFILALKLIHGANILVESS